MAPGMPNTVVITQQERTTMRIILITLSVVIGLCLTQPSVGVAQDKPSTAKKTAVEKTKTVVDDASITASVKTKLLADKTVSGLKIDVDTKDGVVTLNGGADTRAESLQAAKLARNTKGVKRVVNNITVTAPSKPATPGTTKPPAKKSY
jgi:hypothetical protein